MSKQTKIKKQNKKNKTRRGGGLTEKLSDDLKSKIIELLNNIINNFGIKTTIETGILKPQEYVIVDLQNDNFIKLPYRNKRELIFKLRHLYSNNTFNYEINKRIFNILVLLQHETMDKGKNSFDNNKLTIGNDVLTRFTQGHLRRKFSIPMRNGAIHHLLSSTSLLFNIPTTLVSSLINNWQTAYDNLNTFYHTTISPSNEYVNEIENLKTNLENEIQRILNTINK